MPKRIGKASMGCRGKANIAMAVVGLLLTGCPGGGGGGGVASDSTPPIVSSAYPTNAATGVVLNTTVSAAFSEAMDATTLTTATFSLSTGGSNVAGTMDYTGTTVTFTPSANLTSNTPYIATITTGAKDAAGNALAANYVWSFTTGTTLAAPQNLAATSGNHSVHLTWDAVAVAGATGYRVYLSPNAISDTIGLTGVSVPTSLYDATGLTNYQPIHARVTAVTGAVEGPLSNEAVATPNPAGFWLRTPTPDQSHLTGSRQMRLMLSSIRFSAGVSWVWSARPPRSSA